MNYIFLDIDGVLNNINRMKYLYTTRKENPNWNFEYNFDENSYKALGEICVKSNAKVIITSSWRRSLKFNLDHDLTKKTFELFSLNNINIIGYTDLEEDGRANQIKRYIKKYLTKNDSFVILDDESNPFINTDLKNYLYLIDGNVGLQENDIQKINKMFLK